ncbi:MAG: hypothetical protein QXR48_02830 [Candidatus Woesearchaeota archaeon]
MKENSIENQNAFSLAEVVSGAKKAHKDNKDLMPFANMLWRGVYEQMPYLNYNTEENLDEGNNTPKGYASVKGNPDICAALKDCLIKAGMPDCIATLRLVLPAFWFTSKYAALEPCQMKKNKEYLWVLNKEKHKNARNAYAAEFEEQKEYILSNLIIALDTKQNL